MSRDSGNRGGMQVQTLLISSAAAVVAAIVVPLFWARGTIIATAVTPIVIAVASEALRRPAERISHAAPRVARRTATGAAVRRPRPAAAETEHPEELGARGRGAERFDPLAGGGTGDGVSADDPFGLRAAHRPRRQRPWLRLGLVTGVLAFVIGAGVVTASELTVFGSSVTGGDQRTSLFGGKHRASKDGDSTKDDATPTATPTQGAEETPTPTASPAPTATPTPTVGATPTTTPGTTAPAPSATP